MIQVRHLLNLSIINKVILSQTSISSHSVKLENLTTTKLEFNLGKEGKKKSYRIKKCLFDSVNSIPVIQRTTLIH